MARVPPRRSTVRLPQIPTPEAWRPRAVSLRSEAPPAEVVRRLRAELAGPLGRAALQAGLYGEVADQKLRLALLQPMEFSWVRPRLEAHLLADGLGSTRLEGQFALRPPVRWALILAALGFAFVVATVVVRLWVAPRPETFFLALILVPAGLLLNVVTKHLTERYGEVADELEALIGRLLAQAARQAQRTGA